MKCPYCKSPGFPKQEINYANEVCKSWICVKCPNPVIYYSDEKKTAICVLYNDSWYSIYYMPTLKKYIVHHDTFDLHIGDGPKEEYASTVTQVIQLPCEEDNVTPTNARDKLALWLTFS